MFELITLLRMRNLPNADWSEKCNWDLELQKQKNISIAENYYI